jgi:hypothetical protein
MKKKIIISFACVVLVFLAGFMYCRRLTQKERYSADSTTTAVEIATAEDKTKQCSFAVTSGKEAFVVPPLFNGLIWREVSDGEPKSDEYKNTALNYSHTDGEFGGNVRISGRVWTAEYLYASTTDYGMEDNFKKYYEDFFEQRCWSGKTRINEYVLNGVFTSNTSGSMEGRMIVSGGMLRVFTIGVFSNYINSPGDSGSYAERIGRNETSFDVFESDVVSLSDIFPEPG